MPPAIRASTPNVPYSIPKASVESPSPPSSRASFINATAIFPSCDSASRKKNRNTTSPTTPGIFRKLRNAAKNSASPLPLRAGRSPAAFGIAAKCHSAISAITAAASASATHQPVFTESERCSITPASITNPPCTSTEAIR